MHCIQYTMLFLLIYFLIFFFVNPRWNKGDVMWKNCCVYLQNPCASSPCQHPSVLCQAGFTDRGYRCVCNKTGFVGEKCEKGIAYSRYIWRTEKPLQKRLWGLERKKKLETSMSDARKIKIDHSLKGLFVANVNISSGHSVTKLFRRKSKSIFAKSKVLSS